MGIISETFSDPSGRFLQYGTFDTVTDANIRSLKHRDIRSMYQNDLTTPLTILDLDLYPVSVLDTMTMTQIESLTKVIKPGEHWTNATVTIDATRGNFPVLSLTCTSTLSFTDSTMPPVDLLTDFNSDDYITIALPSFPANSLNLNTSFVRFADANVVVDVNFSQSVTPLTNGNSEFRFPRSLLERNSIDLSNILNIGLFFFKTSGTPVVRAMSIRLVSKNWVAASVDQNTIRGLLTRTPPVNGDVTSGSAFTQPILWRSSAVVGVNDPKPIDAEVGVVFNTGTVSANSRIVTYFRETTDDFLTQLDLDGTTMAQLDGKPQPDVGPALFSGRTQADLATHTQGELQGLTQTQLQRTIDSFSGSWIEIGCRWGLGTAAITVQNTESTGYLFDLPILTPNQSYVLIAKVEDRSARARLYTLGTTGQIANLVFDSGTIEDDSLFPRRKGRFGWYADLRDGDAWIESIDQRSISFAEYKSLPLRSVTPVSGAELFVTTSPDVELYSSLAPGHWNSNNLSQISRDKSRSTTGESWKIVDSGLSALQGFETNVFELSDFENTEMTFDIFYPSSSARVHAVLIDESGRKITPLSTSIPALDQWQKVKLKFAIPQIILTGNYKVVLYQDTIFPSTWWVDNVHIFTRSIQWDGRSVIDDAWYSNDAPWTPFRNVRNRVGGGVLFAHRGLDLQIRGRALRPDSTINRVQFKPKYVELGKFVTGTPPTSPGPTASFSQSSIGSLAVRLTDTSTDSSGGYIAIHEWDFGDGESGIGSVVDHTYLVSGVYTVTLLVKDNNNKIASAVATVSV